MFNKKTTFILGAGASKEANFPLGEELNIRIKELLDFSTSPRYSVGSEKHRIMQLVNQYIRRMGWTD